jgi:hypothetical protein
MKNIFNNANAGVLAPVTTVPAISAEWPTLKPMIPGGID